MGRSYTPKYVVKFNSMRSLRGEVSSTPLEWSVKRYGAPTTANIGKFAEVLENSTKPGGANAHLGYDPIVSAVVLNNRTREPVAVWERPFGRSAEKPLFEIIN